MGKPKFVAEGARALSASNGGGTGFKIAVKNAFECLEEKEWPLLSTQQGPENMLKEETDEGARALSTARFQGGILRKMKSATKDYQPEAITKVDLGARALKTSDVGGRQTRAKLCGDYGSCCDEDCHQECPNWKTKKSQAAMKAERRKLNFFQTIEPDQINRVTQDGKWEEIELAVDSGASESVAPKTMPETIATVEGASSKRGVMYEVASGHQIPNEGEKKFTAVTEEGQERKLTLQVCDVNQGLLSVSKMTQAGNRVVFDQDGSYVENKLNGERTWLHDKNGMFLMKLWVKRPF